MKQRLTAKEEEVMEIIWNTGNVFIRDIVAQMPDPKPSYNTVATQVKFLEEKGFLVRKSMANSFQYSPAFSEKEYRGRTILSMISQFVEDEKMSLDEIKELITQIENKRK